MASRAYNIPNLLTYGRILAVPLIVICFFVEGKLSISNTARWVALWIFIIASITDFLDGYLARIWNQTSNIGRMLDPIADKLLIASILLLVAADQTIAGWSLWAAIIILCREILVSGLREYLAQLKVSISVPVTRIAKWKTTAQMVAIAFLLAGPAGEEILPHTTQIGIALLWISAILTIYSGYDYFRVGLKHIVDDEG
ncbi:MULTISPECIES: CDP-diacylglycerol--glycerol-3-phosphate 3-phosphatidyltransferase [Rhizobium]|uniref:CDP-diacylglycerol--glycerol-3-phosphate 3-phosphatidyltransferase n=1 Tax=Rhizobium rhododendri TaxID=2506430 RepID=A0ABY8IL35_9HYPH|nr:MULTISPECIES: CDP-diacylglycerol--glycerol-3-phosphate 3-phosphatidyltransferase [Rhizobium]MBZ5760133.1 CDP-diacylglycerol--glycerol-3-phosphate 3-phosphatidyltransferase [Rhizobium sp. VS19-DR96]MBZ5766386.1 CDP-diacylglycerol--glycerol-3-phosphate 3-phosphatidyltransferase [Rhizobium sp. VS19-DR129.2]MBZ5774271.1 CDP-diacylglycerol--glycerol-3-phosphate 3-phosphatidyltransferase [Rhizobium sp. VS19-DRK62.2]MBZ5785343.1 CDP-diacylglycerol--glycerol-3-phosphate 3-phosphatidyltransferase [Rh